MRMMGPSIKAKEIIDMLRIENSSEIHIKDIAMTLGALVREKYLEGSEARLVRKGNLAIITIKDSIPEVGRKRFAIAHELGHFQLHDSSQLIFCSETDMYIWHEDKQQEMEANEFASCLLMPEDIFIRYYKSGQPNLHIAIDLANEFRTTLTATTLRYVKLSKEPCAIVISKDRIIKWYKPSNDFEFHVRVGEVLSPFTNAFDFYEGKNMPTKPEKVPAASWIAGDIDQEAELFEHSLAIPSYGVVLSLLWINEEIHRKSGQYDDDAGLDLTNPFTRDGKRWHW